MINKCKDCKNIKESTLLIYPDYYLDDCRRGRTVYECSKLNISQYDCVKNSHKYFENRQ